jgi:hypothetical protein
VDVRAVRLRHDHLDMVAPCIERGAFLGGVCAAIVNTGNASLVAADVIRGEAPALDAEDLVSYRRLAAREDPFGLATWRRRSPIQKVTALIAKTATTLCTSVAVLARADEVIE